MLKVPGPVDPQRQCAWIARDRPELLPLEHACVTAVGGYETFPNFVCDVEITRLQTAPSGSAPIRDRITGELTFLDGEEHLIDVHINGYAATKAAVDKSMWTEGEFGPPGLTVLSGTDNPQFVFQGEQSVSERTMLVFNYKVDKEHSKSWTVAVGDVPYHPAYHGSLWIDKLTGVVRRVTMEVDEFEKWVPYATMLNTTEYASVAIAELGTYLLPTRSGSKACWRGVQSCSEIAREFKRCRRFKAKARVVE